MRYNTNDKRHARNFLIYVIMCLCWIVEFGIFHWENWKIWSKKQNKLHQNLYIFKEPRLKFTSSAYPTNWSESWIRYRSNGQLLGIFSSKWRIEKREIIIESKFREWRQQLRSYWLPHIQAWMKSQEWTSRKLSNVLCEFDLLNVNTVNDVTMCVISSWYPWIQWLIQVQIYYFYLAF